MLRREFLKLTAESAVAIAVQRTLGLLVNMSQTVFKSSCYYRHEFKALAEQPDTTSYQGWPNVCHVDFEHGGSLRVWVNPRQHRLAGIEASALLDLSEVNPSLGTLGLCLSSVGKWKAYPWAPYGLNRKMGPLIPGRDAAHNHLPFASQLVWGPPRGYEEIFRPVAYVSDRFGGEQPEGRIDLFAASEVDWGLKTIRMTVNKPWSGVSSRPTMGAQQALNKLGYLGADGKVLDEDNIPGDNTYYALGCFLGEHRHRFTWGVPKYAVPWDCEIFYLLRDAARTRRS